MDSNQTELGLLKGEDPASSTCGDAELRALTLVTQGSLLILIFILWALLIMLIWTRIKIYRCFYKVKLVSKQGPTMKN